MIIDLLFPISLLPPEEAIAAMVLRAAIALAALSLIFFIKKGVEEKV